jgi:hypothetical protein
MKNLALKGLRWLTNFLKENGLMPMTDDEILSRIPKEAMTFAQVFEEVKKMSEGDSRTFVFDPRDRFFANGHFGVALIGLQKECAVSFVFDVRPRKGRYFLCITL